MAKRQRAYIVISHSATPHEDDGKQNITETCEFVDNLKDRHYTSATAIIDYINKKMIKQRDKVYTYEHYMTHVHTKYPREMHKLKQVLHNML